MIVKSKLIDNKNTNEYEARSQFLTAGKVYIVLELLQNSNREDKYPVIADNGTPILEKSSQFEMIDKKQPASWSRKQYDENFTSLSPLAWQNLGFWERYFDREPEAIEIYERELKKIIEDS